MHTNMNMQLLVTHSIYKDTFINVSIIITKMVLAVSDATDCEPELGKIWKTKVLDFTCKHIFQDLYY